MEMTIGNLVILWSSGFWILLIIAMIAFQASEGFKIVKAVREDPLAVANAEWIAMAGILVASLWGGYLVLHKRICAQIVKRSFELGIVPNDPRRSLVAICHVGAPLCAFGLFHVKMRLLITMHAAILFLVIFIYLIEKMPQPWEEFLHLGLTMTFAIAFFSMIFHTYRGYSGVLPKLNCDWPDGSPFSPPRKGKKYMADNDHSEKGTPKPDISQQRNKKNTPAFFHENFGDILQSAPQADNEQTISSAV